MTSSFVLYKKIRPNRCHGKDKLCLVAHLDGLTDVIINDSKQFSHFTSLPPSDSDSRSHNSGE